MVAGRTGVAELVDSAKVASGSSHRRTVEDTADRRTLKNKQSALLRIQRKTVGVAVARQMQSAVAHVAKLQRCISGQLMLHTDVPLPGVGDEGIGGCGSGG